MYETVQIGFKFSFEAINFFLAAVLIKKDYF